MPSSDRSGAVALKEALSRVLDSHKAENIIDIDLAGKTDIADFMLIATAGSSRHAVALSEKVIEAVKAANPDALPRAEGTQTGDWVLIDAGDIIVHIFRAEAREYYKLENMWNAPVMGAEARRTVTLGA